MGKGGGAGKVYFVLYLAVVLELLIIIVERDEAEEGLLKKQRETMKIVESILSQLQAGAGTEGINTRPQDEITYMDPSVNAKELLGVDVKPSRKYYVEVGVTDIMADLKRKEGESEKDYEQRIYTIIKLGNVQEIEYQVFYSPSEDPVNAPIFPNDEELKKQGIDPKTMNINEKIQTPDGNSWEFLASRKLILDTVSIQNRVNTKEHATHSTIEPVYPKSFEVQRGSIEDYTTKDKKDSSFYYSIKETYKLRSESDEIPARVQNLIRRAFGVNFEPPRKTGWFKLRFASRTNRILGVRAGENPKAIPDEAKVSIGTVSLTVKDLKKVLKELTGKLDKYNPPSFDILAIEQDIVKFETMLNASIEKASTEEDAAKITGNLKLYGYINKLLAPGQSVNFPQNTGSMEFNVRVILPDVKAAKPELVAPNYVPSFDKVPAVFEMTVAPWMGNNVVTGKVTDVNTGGIVARVDFKGLDEINPSLPKPINGQKRDFRATISETLSPGKYKVEVTHNIGASSPKVENFDLEIFPSKLTEQSEKFITARMEVLYFGGSFILINPEPSSGGKIKPDQFRIYLSTDRDNQRSPLQGLSITRENSIFLDCNVKEASLRITWVQPGTGTEIDLLPLNTKQVRQRTPGINTGEVQTSVDVIAANRIRVKVKNIIVSRPEDGKDATSSADITVDVDKKVTIGGDMQGVEVYSEPTISQEAGRYTVSFDLNVNLPKGVDAINGTAAVRITARAKNSCNPSIVSNVESKNINAAIKYEPESGGNRRGGGGGGTTPRGGRR